MDLLKITLDGAPHFVRCFKPNGMKRPNQLDVEDLKKQMIYGGILETVKARKTGYPFRLTFAELLKRYCFLGFSFDERVVATKDNCQVQKMRN
jgi:myosin-3